MPENLVKNGGFEADWGEQRSHRCLVFPTDGTPYEKNIENIFTPPHWLTWFRHEPGDWSQPEVTETKKNHRVRSGEKSIRLFTFQRRHDAGFLQQLEVEGCVVTIFLRSKTLWAFRNSDAYWDDVELVLTPEGALHLTAWAHAWSNHKVAGYEHYGNAICSVGVECGAQFILEGDAPPLNGNPLNDAIGNFTFHVGVDPTGGIDPFADTVVWGQGAHIYNAYAQVPAVEVTPGSVPPNPPPPQPPPATSGPRGNPRVQYARTYVLLPPDAEADWTKAVIRATWDEERYTVGSSADDAGIGNLEQRRVIAVNPQHWPGDLRSFFEVYYPGVEYVAIEADTPESLAAQLAPATSPPTTTSVSKLGVHVLRAAAGTPVSEKLAQYVRDNPAKPVNYPSHTGAQAKRLDNTPYHVPLRKPARAVVILPQIEDAVERLDWRTAAAIGSSSQLRAVGHALDDGVGTQDRDVVVVNPKVWDEDLRAWYNRRYPRADYQTIESDSPWEIAIKLLPALQGDIALAQSDPRWADYDFGERIDAPTSQETIGNYGGLLTNLTIMLRKVYRRDITPPVLDKLLVAARAAYSEDNFMAWENTVPLFPIFDQAIKDNTPRSAQTLKQLLRDGWEIILREASGDHFAYLESVKGNTLTIIDAADGERKEAAAADYAGIRAARVKKGASPDQPTRGSLTHNYVLLPQIEDGVERLEWRAAAAIGSSDQMWAFGHSVDDAGVGLDGHQIIAVNPEKWNGARRPRAPIQTVETASPWEMAVELMPILEEDIALAQTDPRWRNYDFGAHPDTPSNGETIGGFGCFLTGLAIILRKVYQRAVTPALLDKLLVAARAGYYNDNFMTWETAVPLFPAFDDNIKDNKQRSARELKRLLRAGWEIVLRRADGGHFVYLEDIEGNTLHTIDTWDGARKRKAATDFSGIRAAHVKLNGNASLPYEVAVGLHDKRGGEWMVSQGLEGCCLVHHVVQRGPVQIDCRQLQNAGLTVIARLNWGYADGSGTLPRPQDKNAFVNAVVETILAAKGVDYFHVGNEPNNRSEWPGFGSNDVLALTPQYIVDIYNAIWQRVGNRAKLGPPPLDPYFGPGSNNRDWWLTILNNIDGADALFLHAKTQTNDPNEVHSRVRFSDEPLTWQYLHLRTVETSLVVVPSRFRSLPVYVTELNPQYLKEIKGENGWLPDNAEWVHEAIDYFRYERPVTGVVFYRYESAGDQAPYGLEDKPAILRAIEEAAQA
jgi:hypothetical protein